MQHVGSRNQPSLISLSIIVVSAVVVVVYAIISFATGDWLWFSSNFRETPKAIVLHCYGETIDIDPGSFDFSKFKQIMNESMSGRKRWDPLSMSEETYQEYQTSAQMVVLEFFYPQPVRVHSSYKYYSYVDNLVIPLEGRHSQTNAVFGQANGIPTGGSLHIDSTDQFKTYLNNMELCPANPASSN
ncbi:MAG: hypothetical protein ACWGOY_06210 [Anaerolineales bacterium]